MKLSFISATTLRRRRRGWAARRTAGRALAGFALVILARQLPAQDVPAAVIHVTVSSSAGPLHNAIVASGATGAQTDAQGRATLRLPAGSRVISARYLGYAPDSQRVVVTASSDTSIAFVLTARAAVIAPVVVTSTRTERRVEEEPLRVEVLAGEDVGEKTQMHPADLRTLLTEMSGVRVQTTSPSLGAASVRVQGLRGRYTQILTDGLPLYGAQAGTFGLLQIPPLELRQAEVVKGAASALYGPGALGGVLDLVSRRPPDSSEAIVNQTGRGGTDAVVFASGERSPFVGATLLAGAHLQRATDLNGDGWSDLPGFRRVELRPRLFVHDSAGRSLMLTVGGFTEQRGGGSTLDGGVASAATFPESLSTRHADVGATAFAPLSGTVSIAARVAANVQSRARRFGSQHEDEHMSTLFGELTTTYADGANTLLGGVVVQLERYRNVDVSRFDEDRSTPAVFAQHTWTPADWLSTQLNGRCDRSSVYGTICTPRVSILAHAGRVASIRLSSGAGWAAPSALTEETEVIGLTRVTGPLHLAAERARTSSVDVGTTRGPLELSGTLFTSRVTDPVGLRATPGDTAGGVELVNAAGPTRVHGAELFAVYNEEPIVVTAYYAATRSRETSPRTGLLRESPLVPREAAGLDVAFDEDDSGTRVGFEAFYTGPQALDENPYRTVSPAYTTIGILASQQVGRAMVYLNLENLTNVRQTRFDPLLLPSPGDGGRRTVDAWGPLEGRAVNVGMRFRL